MKEYTSYKVDVIDLIQEKVIKELKDKGYLKTNNIEPLNIITRALDRAFEYGKNYAEENRT